LSKEHRPVKQDSIISNMDVKHGLAYLGSLAALTLQGCDIDIFGLGINSSSSSDEGLYATSDRYNDLLSVTADIDRDIISFDRFTTRRLDRSEHMPFENIDLDRYDDAVRAFFDPNDSYKLSDASGEASNAQHVTAFNAAFSQYLDPGRIWYFIRKNNEDLNAAKFNTDQSEEEGAKTELSLDWTVVLPQFDDSIRQYFDENYKIDNVVEFNNALGTRLSTDKYLPFALSHINNQLVQIVFDIDILAPGDVVLRFSLPKSGLNKSLDKAALDMAAQQPQTRQVERDIAAAYVQIEEANSENIITRQKLGYPDRDDNSDDTAFGAIQAAREANGEAKAAISSASDETVEAEQKNTQTKDVIDDFNKSYNELTKDFDARLGHADTEGTIVHNASKLTEDIVGSAIWKNAWSIRNQLQRTITSLVRAAENDPEFISVTDSYDPSTVTGVIESHENLLVDLITTPGYPCVSCAFGNFPNFLADTYQSTIVATIGSDAYPDKNTYDFLGGVLEESTISRAIYGMAQKIPQLNFTDITALEEFLTGFPNGFHVGVYDYVIDQFTHYTPKDSVFKSLQTFVGEASDYGKTTLFNYLTNDYFGALTTVMDYASLNFFIGQDSFGAPGTTQDSLQEQLDVTYAQLSAYNGVSEKVGPATSSPQTDSEPTGLFQMIGSAIWPSDIIKASQRSISSAISEIEGRTSSTSQNIGLTGIATNIQDNEVVAESISDRFKDPTSALFSATAAAFVTKGAIERVTAQWSAYVSDIFTIDDAVSYDERVFHTYSLHGVITMQTGVTSLETADLDAKLICSSYGCNTTEDVAGSTGGVCKIQAAFDTPSTVIENEECGCVFYCKGTEQYGTSITDTDENTFTPDQVVSFDLYGGSDADFFGTKKAPIKVKSEFLSVANFVFYVPFSRMVDRAVNPIGNTQLEGNSRVLRSPKPSPIV